MDHNNDKEITVIASAALDDIEVRDKGAISKEAFGRTVSDVDNVSFSGKEAYGKSLETAIEFLWKKVNDGVKVSPDSKSSVERAAAYYAMIDKSISDIVKSDVTASIPDESMDEFEKMRTAINDKHRAILASVLSKHSKPDEDICEQCGMPLFGDHCLICEDKSGQQSDGELVKNAASPSLQFFENGFIVGLATDISNYVITSGFNLNDAIKIAKDSFDLSPREEYRLRKYLNYMGYMAPQMIWLPASEVKHS